MNNLTESKNDKAYAKNFFYSSLKLSVKSNKVN